MPRSVVWTISTSTAALRETSDGTDPSSRPATLLSPTLPTTSRSAWTSSTRCTGALLAHEQAGFESVHLGLPGWTIRVGSMGGCRRGIGDHSLPPKSPAAQGISRHTIMGYQHMGAAAAQCLTSGQYLKDLGCTNHILRQPISPHHGACRIENVKRRYRFVLTTSLTRSQARTATLTARHAYRAMH